VGLAGCTIILSKLFNIRQTLASLRWIIKVFRASDLAPDVAQQKPGKEARMKDTPLWFIWIPLAAILLVLLINTFIVS
jgi:type VI protein secretion system component VasF